MSVLNTLRGQIRRFRKDEGGWVAVESLIMFPLLAWAFVATSVYFHAYRSENVAAKATLTIADMLSREKGFINSAYLNGTRDLLEFLAMSKDRPEYRLTVFTWDQSDNRYEVRWSRRRGSEPLLTTSSLASMTSKLPTMVDGERAILLETWVSYKPAFEQAGLNEFEFENFIVISPRSPIASQLCWNNDPNEDPKYSRC